MPVAKGEPWGEPGTLGAEAPIFDTDHDLSRAVEFNRVKGYERVEYGLTGGDLWRTLGGPPGGVERLRGGPATRVTVDVGWVQVDDSDLEHAFVAHCVLRTRMWGSVVAIMNAEWLNRWDMAPRSHPGDGWLDIVQAALGWRERDKVRRRLATGSHLPHPEISVSKVRETEFALGRPTRLYLDGTPFSRVRRLKVRLEPASLTVLV